MKPVLSALLLMAFAGPVQDRPQNPPNVLFILVDDMGWGDLHCYGHPYAKTPNLDRLASDGIRFSQCYATGVTCCPSRTGFMTSKFPATFAKYPAAGGFGERVTITELHHRQGYATGHFGKWHIGPESKPGTYGIDAVGADEGGGKKAEKNQLGRDAPIYEAAIKFIEKNKDKPFYVNLWDHIPHHPVNPSKAVIDAFGPLEVDESKFPEDMRAKFALCKKLGGNVSEHMRAYLAELKSVDDQVGLLLKRLDELGLREKTLIAFSSDQGPAGIRDPGDNPGGDKDGGSDVRLNAMGFAGPFRGGKHNQYEGGIRIPFIVRWTGRVPAGRVDEQSVLSGADWLPSICGLAGVALKVEDFDGEDASRALLGQGEFVRTKPLFWKTSAPRSEGAMREGPWKLHHPNSKRGELELYDVVADPGERRNLAAQNPDVVKTMSARLEAWQATLPKSYDKIDDGDK